MALEEKLLFEVFNMVVIGYSNSVTIAINGNIV